MKRRWLQNLLKWKDVDEMIAAKEDFWAMRNLNVNYISNPGHIEGRVLRPICFQKSRRLRNLYRRKSFNAFVYETDEGAYFIKNMGNKYQARPWAVQGMPFYRRWIFALTGRGKLPTEWRRRNDYWDITSDNKNAISDAVD